MDPTAALRSQLSLRALEPGLREVVGGWSEAGDIYSAFGHADATEGISWKASDVRRRAQRVLLSIVATELATWPTTLARWNDALPPMTVPRRSTSTRLVDRVDWARTVRRHGWPSTQFELRRREHKVDDVALSVLGWLTRNLTDACNQVGGLAPDLVAQLQSTIDVAASVVASFDVEPQRPDRLDLGALATSGSPWASVGRAAETALRAEIDPEFIAYELILPEPTLSARLFHLATFGMVMRSLKAHRFILEWQRPVGGTAAGPHINAISPTGRALDLWFEAAATRKYYSAIDSPYPDVVASIDGAGGPIGADVLLKDDDRVLLLESKWSPDPSYVGRNGYHQAASYALEAKVGLAQHVWSFIVGPHDVVEHTTVAYQLLDPLGVLLGATSPQRLGDVVAAFLADDPSTL